MDNNTDLSSHPTYSQLKVLGIIAGFVIIAIVAGITGYFLGMRNNQPGATIQLSSSPQPISATPEPSGLNNWITYSANGYSFEYPKDWTVTQGDRLNTITIINPANTTGITISDPVGMTITELNYPQGLSGPNKFATQNIQFKLFNHTYTKKEITVNNQSTFVNFETETEPKYLIELFLNRKEPSSTAQHRYQ